MKTSFRPIITRFQKWTKYRACPLPCRRKAGVGLSVHSHTRADMGIEPNIGWWSALVWANHFDPSRTVGHTPQSFALDYLNIGVVCACADRVVMLISLVLMQSSWPLWIGFVDFLFHQRVVCNRYFVCHLHRIKNFLHAIRPFNELLSEKEAIEILLILWEA